MGSGSGSDASPHGPVGPVRPRRRGGTPTRAAATEMAVTDGGPVGCCGTGRGPVSFPYISPETSFQVRVKETRKNTPRQARQGLLQTGAEQPRGVRAP